MFKKHFLKRFNNNLIMGLCDAKLLPFLQLHYRGINGPNPAYMWSLNGWQQPTVTDLWPNWWTAYGRKVDSKRSVSTRYTIRSPSSLVSQWLPSSTVTGVILAQCTTSWHALKETYYASFFFFFLIAVRSWACKGFWKLKSPKSAQAGAHLSHKKCPWPELPRQ